MTLNSQSNLRAVSLRRGLGKSYVRLEDKRLVAVVVVLVAIFVQASVQPSEPTPLSVRHVTIRQEIELGNAVAAKVRRQFGGPWYNPEQLSRVKSIAFRLFNASDRHENRLLRANFTVELVDSNTINAVCVPGGHTFVTRGLVQLGVTDDELACVMGHEIAHAARRHGARNLETSAKLQSIVNAFTERNSLRKLAHMGILVYLFKHFDPELEFEADYYGEIYASRAGFDPQGMVTLFERFEDVERGRTGSARLQRMLLSLFDNHPPTPERIARASDEAERINRGESLPTTPVPIYP